MIAGTTRKTSLVLADDHPIVLRGMTELLGEEVGVELVSTCADGRDALRAIRHHRPDLAVLDVQMPEFSGLEVLATIREERLDTRLVLLTAAITDAELLDAITMGLDGLVLKDALPAQLVHCVREVAAGRRFLPKGLVEGARLRDQERREAGNRVLGELTERERMIAVSVAEGLSNKAIAGRLSVTEGTVKVHLHNIYRKLGVTNRTSLAAMAMSHAEYLSRARRP